MHGKPHAASRFMVFLLVWHILISNIIGLVFLLLQRTPYAGMIELPWLIVFTQLAGFILPLVIYLRLRGDNLTPYLPNTKLDTYSIGLIAVISLLLQPGMMFISGLFSLFFPNPAAGAMNVMSETPFLILIIVIAVTPALCEEIVFRGYIQKHQEFMGIKKAAVINGLFFGMMHMNLHQFLYAFAMGIVFAYFVHYTRSIKAGILAHFIVNASQVALHRGAAFFARYVETPVEPTTRDLLEAIGVMGVFALIFTPPAVLLFRAFVNHNKGRNLRYGLDLNRAEQGVQLDPDGFIASVSPVEGDDAKLSKDPYFFVSLALWAGYMLLVVNLSG